MTVLQFLQAWWLFAVPMMCLHLFFKWQAAQAAQQKPITERAYNRLVGFFDLWEAIIILLCIASVAVNEDKPITIVTPGGLYLVIKHFTLKMIDPMWREIWEDIEDRREGYVDAELTEA